jgi:hypothetical protein
LCPPCLCGESFSRDDAGETPFVELSLSDIDMRALGDQAGVPTGAVSIERDETGLAMLVDVVRRPGTVG